VCAFMFFVIECLVVKLVECVVSWCNVCVCVYVFCRRVFGCFVVRMRCFMVLRVCVCTCFVVESLVVSLLECVVSWC